MANFTPKINGPDIPLIDSFDPSSQFGLTTNRNTNDPERTLHAVPMSNIIDYIGSNGMASYAANGDWYEMIDAPEGTTDEDKAYQQERSDNGEVPDYSIPKHFVIKPVYGSSDQKNLMPSKLIDGMKVNFRATMDNDADEGGIVRPEFIGPDKDESGNDTYYSENVEYKSARLSSTNYSTWASSMGSYPNTEEVSNPSWVEFWFEEKEGEEIPEATNIYSIDMTQETMFKGAPSKIRIEFFSGKNDSSIYPGMTIDDYTIPWESGKNATIIIDQRETPKLVRKIKIYFLSVVSVDEEYKNVSLSSIKITKNLSIDENSSGRVRTVEASSTLMDEKTGGKFTPVDYPIGNLELDEEGLFWKSDINDNSLVNLFYNGRIGRFNALEWTSADDYVPGVVGLLNGQVRYSYRREALPSEMEDDDLIIIVDQDGNVKYYKQFDSFPVVFDEVTKRCVVTLPEELTFETFTMDVVYSSGTPNQYRNISFSRFDFVLNHRVAGEDVREVLDKDLDPDNPRFSCNSQFLYSKLSTNQPSANNLLNNIEGTYWSSGFDSFDEEGEAIGDGEVLTFKYDSTSKLPISCNSLEFEVIRDTKDWKGDLTDVHFGNIPKRIEIILNGGDEEQQIIFEEEDIFVSPDNRRVGVVFSFGDYNSIQVVIKSIKKTKQNSKLNSIAFYSVEFIKRSEDNLASFLPDFKKVDEVEVALPSSSGGSTICLFKSANSDILEVFREYKPIRLNGTELPYVSSLVTRTSSGEITGGLTPIMFSFMDEQPIGSATIYKSESDIESIRITGYKRNSLGQLGDPIYSEVYSTQSNEDFVNVSFKDNSQTNITDLKMEILKSATFYLDKDDKERVDINSIDWFSSYSTTFKLTLKDIFDEQGLEKTIILGPKLVVVDSATGPVIKKTFSKGIVANLLYLKSLDLFTTYGNAMSPNYDYYLVDGEKTRKQYHDDNYESTSIFLKPIISRRNSIVHGEKVRFHLREAMPSLFFLNIFNNVYPVLGNKMTRLIDDKLTGPLEITKIEETNNGIFEQKMISPYNSSIKESGVKWPTNYLPVDFTKRYFTVYFEGGTPLTIDLLLKKIVFTNGIDRSDLLATGHQVGTSGAYGGGNGWGTSGQNSFLAASFNYDRYMPNLQYGTHDGLVDVYKKTLETEKIIATSTSDVCDYRTITKVMGLTSNTKFYQPPGSVERKQYGAGRGTAEINRNVKFIEVVIPKGKRIKFKLGLSDRSTFGFSNFWYYAEFSLYGNLIVEEDGTVNYEENPNYEDVYKLVKQNGVVIENYKPEYSNGKWPEVKFIGTDHNNVSFSASATTKEYDGNNLVLRFEKYTRTLGWGHGERRNGGGVSIFYALDKTFFNVVED